MGGQAPKALEGTMPPTPASGGTLAPPRVLLRHCSRVCVQVWVLHPDSVPSVPPSGFATSSRHVNHGFLCVFFFKSTPV
jgi:hypothetical protein